MRALQTNARENEELQRQNEKLQTDLADALKTPTANEIEVAQLRNEIAQLRRQTKDAAAETARLRTQVAEAAENLAHAEAELADTIKRSPEEWQRMIQDEQSAKCANHLKQIGVAIQMWADDHDQAFPPDFVAMQQYLHQPDVLFCPADTTAVPAIDWPELNPLSVRYRLVNPGGNENDSTNALVICPIHRHFVLNDGTVHRQ